MLLLLLDRRGEVGKRHLDRSNSYLVVLDRSVDMKGHMVQKKKSGSNDMLVVLPLNYC